MKNGTFLSSIGYAGIWRIGGLWYRLYSMFYLQMKHLFDLFLFRWQYVACSPGTCNSCCRFVCRLLNLLLNYVFAMWLFFYWKSIWIPIVPKKKISLINTLLRVQELLPNVTYYKFVLISYVT